MKRKKAWIIFTIIVVSFILLPFAILKIAVLAIPLDTLDQPTHITFYDYRDEEIISYVQGKPSEYCTYETINPNLVKAIIKSEDKKFYKHHGFDYARIAQALFINFKSNEIEQGASTITQQVARTLFLDLQKNYTRKFKEAFIAMQIEQKYSKEKIIEFYLNTVFFGKDLFGIERVSQFYFHKSQNELSLAESCIIASLLNSPNKYLDDSTNEMIITRQLNLLLTLYKANEITAEDYQNAINEELNFYKDDSTTFDYMIAYYLDAALMDLSEKGVYDQAALKEGIKIYTNFVPERHEMVVNALKSQKEQLEDIQTSIVLMKPYSNNVEVLIGGKDYQESSYNRPIVAKRQIGSTIKPILYYLSLVNGYSPLTTLRSEKTTFHIEGFGDYSPINYGNLYPNRKINMLEAIAMSDNIYAVKMGLFLGTKTLANSLSSFVEIEEILPSLILGTPEMTLLELASIYNMFASEGVYYQAELVRKVASHSDALIYESEESAIRYLLQPYSLVLNQMLRAPFDPLLESYGTPTMLKYQTTGKYGAKSGSTISDNYVIAFNPLVTMAIWCGNDQGGEIATTNVTKILFRLIAHQFDINIGIKWYQPLSIMQSRRINPITGENYSNGSIYYFY